MGANMQHFDEFGEWFLILHFLMPTIHSPNNICQEVKESWEDKFTMEYRAAIHFDGYLFKIFLFREITAREP